VREKIQETLSSIEADNGVTVLYACESGSRAWGFASADSDFDVRFIYLHPPAWYLSVNLETKRDVIERPITDVLDVSGWDLRKALRLLRKSNPPLLEWLGSPIVYREQGDLARRLRELAAAYCAPSAMGYHYAHMARGNFREYLRGDVVWRKKYFYVLRPLLAIRWLEAGSGIVPTEFLRLLDAALPTGPVRKAVDDLLREKAAGNELDRGPRIPALSDFIAAEIDRLDELRISRAPRIPPVEPLDALFQDQLREVYGPDHT